MVAPALAVAGRRRARSKYCKELNTPSYQKWTQLADPCSALAFFVALPFGWAAFFWLGPIRLVWALHAQCFVNSICHLRPDVPWARRRRATSRWLASCTAFQGEQWHQNHHDRPGSARLGFGSGQLDVGWYTILLLEKTGLATDVRRPDLSRSLDAAA